MTLAYCCSQYARVAEVGILGKSCKLRRDWSLCERVSCSTVATSDFLFLFLFLINYSKINHPRTNQFPG